MVDNFDPHFEKTDSGASKSVPISCSDIKKGSHVVMGEGRPCKVAEITTSKTGKHGHAKANITAIDIFNGKKFTDVIPVSHSKEEPIISRKPYTVLSINEEGYVSLMTPTGEVREDLKLPNDCEDDENTCKRLRDGLDNGKTMVVTVLESMGLEKIEDAKEDINQ